MPKRLQFITIINLKEAMAGRKKLLLRYETFKKSPSQFCIRDNKFQEIFKTRRRDWAEKAFEEYIKLLENPSNPYKSGDIVYEKRGKGKATEDYDFYQVIKTTPTRVWIQKIEAVCKASLFTSLTYINPIKDKFISDENIEHKIEVVFVENYGVTVSYNIRSENGVYEKLQKDSIIF